MHTDSTIMVARDILRAQLLELAPPQARRHTYIAYIRVIGLAVMTTGTVIVVTVLDNIAPVTRRQLGAQLSGRAPVELAEGSCILPDRPS